MKQKTITIILIVLLISLNIGIFIFNKTNYCSKCEIKFVQTATSGVSHESITYSYHPSELYNSLLNNSCIITWERVGGYHANKEHS